MTMLTDLLGAATAAMRCMCAPCRRDEHPDCIGVAATHSGDCECRCVGTVECPTCDKTVVLWVEDPDEPALSNGHCCHWMWASWWDGTFRYDLSENPA